VGVRLKDTRIFLSLRHETQKRFIFQKKNAQKYFVRFEVFPSHLVLIAENLNLRCGNATKGYAELFVVGPQDTKTFYPLTAKRSKALRTF